MSPKVLIFDFDGTIADTLPVIVEILNRYADFFRFKKITSEDIQTFKEKGLRKSMKEFKIPLLLLIILVKKVQWDIGKRIPLLKAFSGMKETMEKMKKNGNTIGIISSNTKGNIEAFLKHNAFSHIDFIENGSIFGKDKVISRIIQKYGFEKGSVYYVGDEIRDIEAGKKAGVKTVAVTWGFSTKKLLKKGRADYVVEKASDLIKIL